MHDYNINLDDMDYSENNGNEYYKGHLNNGDLLEIRKYGHYGNDRDWEWAVYIKSDYPVQCYQRSRQCYDMPTVESCLENFYVHYKPRTWLSREEYKKQYGDTCYRCIECGWEGSVDDIESVDIHEDFGDVVCWKCPDCGRIEYEGMKIFQVIEQ